MSGLKCKVCGSKVDDYGYKIECTKFIGDFYVIKKCHRCKTMSTYPKPTNMRVFYDEDYDSYQKKKSFFLSYTNWHRDSIIITKNQL